LQWLAPSKLAILRAPLWPTGHLPHEGEIRCHAGFRQSPTLQDKRGAEAANLPLVGGDVRQDRGGRCPANISGLDYPERASTLFASSAGSPKIRSVFSRDVLPATTETADAGTPSALAIIRSSA